MALNDMDQLQGKGLFEAIGDVCKPIEHILPLTFTLMKDWQFPSILEDKLVIYRVITECVDKLIDEVLC